MSVVTPALETPAMNESTLSVEADSGNQGMAETTASSRGTSPGEVIDDIIADVDSTMPSEEKQNQGMGNQASDLTAMHPPTTHTAGTVTSVTELTPLTVDGNTSTDPAVGHSTTGAAASSDLLSPSVVDTSMPDTPKNTTSTGTAHSQPGITGATHTPRQDTPLTNPEPMEEDRPISILSPLLNAAIADFAQEIEQTGSQQSNPLKSFRSQIDELLPLMLKATETASMIPHTPSPVQPLGADSLNKQFREAFIIPDRTERKTAIVRAATEFQRIHSLAVLGADSLRPVHTALDNALDAANNFLNAVDLVLEIFEDEMHQVAVTLNAAHAAADIMLHISEKGKAMISDVKEYLRPKRSQLVQTHRQLTAQSLAVDAKFNPLRTLEELLNYWNASWTAQTEKCEVTPATNAWCAKMITFYTTDWPIATAGTMAKVRKNRQTAQEPIQSPFVILPGHLRAIAPHQGLGWWNFGHDATHDFIAIREDMYSDSQYIKDGKFKRYNKDKEVRCIVYNFDRDQFSPQDVERFILRLDLDIVDELNPRMDGSNPLLDVRVTCMTSFLWKMLQLRSGFVGDFVFSIQIAVGIDDGSAGIHGWGNLTHQGRKCLTPQQIPNGLEEHLLKCGVNAIVSPQSLANDWAQAITNSGRFAVSVKQESDWKKLQALKFDDQYIHVQEVTGVGRILELASSKGDFAISAAVGRFPLDIRNLPPRTSEGPFTRLLRAHDITKAGFKRTEMGWKCVVRIGFPSEDMRTSASILLSRRAHPGINGGKPLEVSYVWDVPKLTCPICYHPDHPEGFSRNHPKERGARKAKCPNKESVCSLCHKNDHLIAECGMEFKHQRVATQSHFSVAQSSLSEGALATLGGVQPRSNATASVAESIHSTSQVRPFGNDDGNMVLYPHASHHLYQATGLTKVPALWVLHLTLSSSVALLLALSISTVVEGTRQAHHIYKSLPVLEKLCMSHPMLYTNSASTRTLDSTMVLSYSKKE